MEQAQGQKTPLDTKLNIPLTILTTTFRNYAKRAHTSAEKHYLFTVVEGLGTTIAQQTRATGGPGGGPGGTGNNGGFDTEEFMSECGVDPQWATIAA
jgi:hypothetical protein